MSTGVDQFFTWVLEYVEAVDGMSIDVDCSMQPICDDIEAVGGMSTGVNWLTYRMVPKTARKMSIKNAY